jgi:hypothetical protein
VAKVLKEAALIADLMTGEDVEVDLKVLREALPDSIPPGSGLQRSIDGALSTT